MFLIINNLSEKNKKIIIRSFENNNIPLRKDEESEKYIIDLHAKIDIFTLIRAINESGFETIKVKEDNCYNRIITIIE